uniref:NlpC/P60 family protein n=2 Tax=Streptomyces TaxID=1883 RepID=UPI003EBF46EA
MSSRSALQRSAVAAVVVAAVCTASPAALAAAPISASTTTQADKGYGSEGQGPVTPVGPSAFGARSAAVTAPTISRSSVIQRAATWVGEGLDYNQGAYHDGYRMDCSGYVSMAWKLSSSLTTNTFAGAGVTKSISKGDLKAGDALLNDAAGNSGHVALFHKWANDAHTSYWGYEFSSSGVHHREIPYPYFSGYGTFLPVRNTSVVDDAPPVKTAGT